MTPFKIHVPQAAIDDLHSRLRSVRWPDRETVNDWSQGVPLAEAKSLIDYWLSKYSWSRFEARIDKIPQFRTLIDGLGIHFIHVRSEHPEALPIILTHGWPGSFMEFLDVIERLTNPVKFGGKTEDAFHVVVPSLPGYAFSDKPTEPGWDAKRVAKAWAVLMEERLGYRRWVAQGGDWGAFVTHELGHLRPEGLVAAHVDMPLVFPNVLPTNLNQEEQIALDAAKYHLSQGSGYFHEQATRPQTLGYALADSAVGQALWIYEKFQAWTNNKGHAEDALTRDQMLDDISLYWFTNTATSSARFYWEMGGGKMPDESLFSSGKIELPMAASLYGAEKKIAPRIWASTAWPNLFYWNEVPHGGHFAALEQPALFSAEMWKAFRTIR